MRYRIAAPTAIGVIVWDTPVSLAIFHPEPHRDCANGVVTTYNPVSA